MAVLCVMALAARCVAEVAVDLEVELDRAPPATATGEPSSSTCSSLCSQTYPEHTYPNVSGGGGERVREGYSFSSRECLDDD